LDRRRVFQIVVIAAALAAYLTIVIGGDLTASDAGFACQDSWPFCPGGVIPDLSQPGVAIEFTHRVVAFATSLLILATLILAFLWFRKDRRIFPLSVTTFLILFAQVLLGMVTVQTRLDPSVVTAHLAIGTATFAVALVLAVVLSLTPPSKAAAEPLAT
jgi:cytochrome c oxidase assembly protein subunit 15